MADLETMGLLADDVPTPEGWKLLEPHRVHNAVIMAAGVSSRFVPFSYELPKGLLPVRGEVQIERQIRQLREAGIMDITVVVGYLADRFRYLADEFGVRIVENPDYKVRNNNSTLWHVRELLGNTYICSSDNYFTDNPFTTFVRGAYYASQYVEGPTDEWCLTISSDDMIEGVRVGGSDSWIMLGHVFFDEAFSEHFRSILEQEYFRPETAGKLWEAIFAEHLPELRMSVRRFPSGVIHEFDSVDEVEAFDPAFLDTVPSTIIDNIVGVLGCARREVHDFSALSEGLTNLSFHFSVGDHEYVYRHPGLGTDKMIDRANETKALLLARELGLDHTFIHEDEKTGWKLSHFIPNAHSVDPSDPSELQGAMELARRLHESGAVLERSFDFYVEGQKYEALMGPGDLEAVPGYTELREKVRTIKEYAVADAFPVCLNHNDFFPLNILVDEDGGLTLIDWEYAGMSDITSDLATFTVCAQLGDDTAEEALGHYLGRTPCSADARHFWAYVALAGWCWYVWALAKEAEGDDIGEWREIYHRYAASNVDRVLAWYRATSDSGDDTAQRSVELRSA